MFILTDGQYPGLPTQVTGIPNGELHQRQHAQMVRSRNIINPTLINPATGENYLFQGAIDAKNTDMSLDGFDKNNVTSSMPSMEQYTGVLVWQDRRNSTDILDSNGNVIDCYVNCGANTPTTAEYEANNVTATSPGLSMSDGKGKLVLNGALYQPTGAWYNLQPGNAGIHELAAHNHYGSPNMRERMREHCCDPPRTDQ